MAQRLGVAKTYKQFIGGRFPRSESGRSWPIAAPDGRVLAHVSRASRKDLRDAVEAARKAQPGWAAASAYNRGQVLYRMAEMLEGRREEFAELVAAAGGPGAGTARERTRSQRTIAEREVAAAIDRLVCFGGWADKHAQVLGCNNPVAGPYYNFTTPEPTGVIAVVAPDERPLLALVSLLAPPLCAGNAIVAVGSEAAPLAAAVFGEVCATSDVPAGVVNILTGQRAELLPHIASHRGIDGIHAAGLGEADAALLRGGMAENLKRVRIHDGPRSGAGRRRRGQGGIDWFDEEAWHGPRVIEPFVEMKTVWHPSGA